jgi:hypothetical protein
MLHLESFWLLDCLKVSKALDKLALVQIDFWVYHVLNLDLGVDPSTKYHFKALLQSLFLLFKKDSLVL